MKKPYFCSLMKNSIIIAIDGPAGSGKSSLATQIAIRLGFSYLDTGAMYRAITYLALKNNVVENTQAIIDIVKNVNISFKFENGTNKIFVDNQDISDEIRTLAVNEKVSEVSVIKEVREQLVALQQKIGNAINVVAEGRDTTTTVFPNADVKIFLVASIDTRTERRHKEFIEKGLTGTSEDIKVNLIKRDKIDSGRDISPLQKADDAIEMDTSNMTIEEEIEFVINILKEKGLLNATPIN